MQKPAQWAGQQLANGEAELRRGIAATRKLQKQSGRPATFAERRLRARLWREACEVANKRGLVLPAG
eukprot:11413377-Alexandrium_andersonii.AAC.1